MYDTDFFTICYKKLICLYTSLSLIMEVFRKEKS